MNNADRAAIRGNFFKILADVAETAKQQRAGPYSPESDAMQALTLVRRLTLALIDYHAPAAPEQPAAETGEAVVGGPLADEARRIAGEVVGHIEGSGALWMHPLGDDNYCFQLWVEERHTEAETVEDAKKAVEFIREILAAAIRSALERQAERDAGILEGLQGAADGATNRGWNAALADGASSIRATARRDAEKEGR